MASQGVQLHAVAHPVSERDRVSRHCAAKVLHEGFIKSP